MAQRRLQIGRKTTNDTKPPIDVDSPVTANTSHIFYALINGTSVARALRAATQLCFVFVFTSYAIASHGRQSRSAHRPNSNIGGRASNVTNIILIGFSLWELFFWRPSARGESPKFSASISNPTDSPSGRKFTKMVQFGLMRHFSSPTSYIIPVSIQKQRAATKSKLEIESTAIKTHNTIGRHGTGFNSLPLCLFVVPSNFFGIFPFVVSSVITLRHFRFGHASRNWPRRAVNTWPNRTNCRQFTRSDVAPAWIPRYFSTDKNKCRKRTCPSNGK